MKVCTKCTQEKLEDEFYFDCRSKTGRREPLCKICKNKLSKERHLKFGYKKTEPAISGYKICNKCNVEKIIIDFAVNRVRLDGREPTCKVCLFNKREAQRKKRGPCYWAQSGVGPTDGSYFTRNCKICDAKFALMRDTHKRCEKCSHLVRSIQIALDGTNKQKLTCSVDTADFIAKKYLKSEKCSYCERNFSDNVKKSLDHIIPISLGGKSTVENINISCLECNFSKRNSLLEDWLKLCSLVVENQGKIPFIISENKDSKPLYDSSHCEICDNKVIGMIHFKKRCKSCSVLFRKIMGHLTSSRGKIKNIKFAAKNAVSLIRRLVAAKNCCYCGGVFSEKIRKSIDHIVPFSLGGLHKNENMLICCLDCNYAKRNLLLSDWLNLCSLIVKTKNSQSELYLVYKDKKEKKDKQNWIEEGYEEISEIGTD